MNFPTQQPMGIEPAMFYPGAEGEAVIFLSLAIC